MSRRINRIIKGMSQAALNLILLLLLAFMAVLCITTLTAAYGRFHAANRAVVELISHIPKDIAADVSKCGTPQDVINDRCASLEASAKGTLDSNAMAFVFQVISLFLITLGGGLLLLMLKKTEAFAAMTRSSAKLAESQDSFVAYCHMSAYWQHALKLSDLGGDGKLSDEQFAVLPQLREQQSRTLAVLDEAFQNRLAISKGLLDLMRGWAEHVLMILERLPTKQIGSVVDLEERGRQIGRLLKRTDWSERYDELISKLQD
ncbi:MAG: hypothetical protein NT018_07915 [Armatimonadetes bacterium]|nr:hypothetical protein [Armatimonadota bacterium]